jgi:hypothetical protein
MEILFDKLSNRSGPISISHRQVLQIINIFCRYFWQELHCRYGLVRHPWDLGLSWNTPQEDGEHQRDGLGRPPPWPPPYEASKDVQAKPEAQSNPSSSLPRPSGPVCNKTDAQDASELRFRWSTYGWKDNFIRKPIQVVSHQNLFRINRNHQNKSASRICQGAATPSFGPLGLITCWDTFRTWRGILERLLGYIISSHHLL